MNGEIKDNKYKLVIEGKTLNVYSKIPIAKQVEIKKTFISNRIGLEGYEITKMSQPHNYRTGDYVIDFDLKKVK